MLKNEIMLLLTSAVLNRHLVAIVLKHDNPFEENEFVFKDFQVIADNDRLAIWDKDTTLITKCAEIESVIPKETTESVSKRLVETPYPQEEVFDDLLEQTKEDRIIKQKKAINNAIDKEIANSGSILAHSEVLRLSSVNLWGCEEIVLPLENSDLDSLLKEIAKVCKNSADLPF